MTKLRNKKIRGGNIEWETSDTEMELKDRLVNVSFDWTKKK